MHIGWPQGIALGLMAMAWCISFIHHAEPTRTVHNFYAKFVELGLTIGLLYWGGFFR